MTFDRAFEKLLGHEGAFQNDPRDRGNWTGGKIGSGKLKGTKYGISAAAYPGEDIQNLTLERAKQLARRDFWGPAGCDAMPDEVKFDLFDTAYNSGCARAIKLLQRAVGETEDGILGPRTLQAAQSIPPLRLKSRFNGQRLLFLADIPMWETFGRGLVKRVAANLVDA